MAFAYKRSQSTQKAGIAGKKVESRPTLKRGRLLIGAERAESNASGVFFGPTQTR